ncbi:S8 family serine peptidase [Actinoplanes sp. NPDC049599]|uniref:S8 family serine peptidase n=1 Tax=Actinoplanes sp. NPDC049599 TaxID=3363903 RepID=UPI0037BAB20E
MRKLAALAVTAVAAAGSLAVAVPARAAPDPAWLGANWLVQTGTTTLSTVIRTAGADRADLDNPDDGDTATGVALTGAGIGVALIDSGVSPVPGLNGAGKVINGPDLSFESQAPNLRYLDTFGHGTHMAGIIAGQDPVAGTGARFAGVAPGAHIVSVKVASADGAGDVSQVIAGIDWVVAHRNDPGLNIKVLNLSYGTLSTQPATLDPLAFAVEKAWEAGIVVVVAAGNDGFTANTLTMPAADPDVIAVGAADTRGTDARTDDVVADFSNRGNAARHADVLATGRSLVSLRSPGSYIDRTYPGARLSLTDDPGQRFLRGSGTSQAAAVVSGSVALLLQQRPGLRPDQIKKMLMSTADPIAGGDAYAAGAGQINVARAARTKSVPGAPQINAAATGLGSLEAARGGAYVYDSVTGTPLTGERDIFGMAWNPRTWTVASATKRSWIGGAWNGSTWTGTAWGTVLAGSKTWAPVIWTGRSWSGSSWTGRSWSGAVWSGRSWSSQTWTGRSWSGRSWSAAGWTGEPWH